MKKKTAISIIISAVFLYIALKGVSPGELAAALKKGNYLYMIPAIAVMYLLFIVRSLRWYYLVKPIKEASFANLFNATIIGFMANNIFPARIGEFVRANILGNDEKVSKSSVFATIVIERLFDGMTILLILLVTFFTVDLTSRLSYDVAQNLKKVAYGAFLLYIGVIAFIYLLHSKYELAQKIISTVLKPFPETFLNFVQKIVVSFKAGLKIEKDPKNIAIIVFYSLLHWIFCAFPIYIILKGFGYTLPLEAAYVILIMKAFAVMVPAAPGYIGTLNVAVIYALTFYGVPKNEGVSVSLIIYLVDFLPPVMLGFILLWRKNLSIKGIEDTNEIEQD